MTCRSTRAMRPIPIGLLRGDVRERGDVVRAIRHFRDFDAPGFSPVCLAHVLPNLGGRLHFHRLTRDLCHTLFVVHPLPSNGGDV
jgi:hypothetical protein